MNIDKVREERQLEGVEIWIKKGCKGTLHYGTGVGKTYTALLAIDRIERTKKPMYLITAPSEAALDQWKDQLNARYTKTMLQRVILKTPQTLLSEKIKYQVDVYIVDEAHEYASEERRRLINGELVDYKTILCLTASAEDTKYRFIKKYAPVIDVITEKESIDKGFTADFVEYNIGLSLSGKELEAYNIYSEIISEEIPKFNKDLSLAQRCIGGGKDPKTKAFYAAPNWCYGVAVKKGWSRELDLSIETNLELHELYSPGAIQSSAFRLMKAVRKRKDILIHAESKYEVTSQIIKRYDKVKTIVFSESTDFADVLYEAFKDTGRVTVYHSNLKTVVKPSPKTGKPIKMGAVRRKREALEAIKSGEVNVILTSKALDRAFDVADLRISVTASGTQGVTQYKQRGGRVKRKEMNIFDDCTVLLINLYIRDTQDEKWLINRQSATTHKIIDVDSVDDIKYSPPPNKEYL